MQSMRGAQTNAQTPSTGSERAEIQDAYRRVLSGSSVRSRHIEVGSKRVHVLEKGTGAPIVILHGTGNAAGFLRPLLEAIDGLRVIAPDLPGSGLSEPVELPRRHYRQAAVAWLEALLDALELPKATLVGHSGGAMWAAWYALARPNRVKRLVLMAPPAVPGTRCPVPLRLVATPVIADLLSRLAPPSPKSMLQLAGAMGERSTIAQYPDLIDLMVALGRDPINERAAKAEFRALLSPFALLSRSGFRRGRRLRTDELGSIAVPTLLIWGERDPLGDRSVAIRLAERIPGAQLKLMGTGHGPWLGQPQETAKAITEFAR